MDSKASDIDFAMVNSEFQNFICAPCKHSTSTQRMATMHSNKIVNIKAKFETLHGVNLNDIACKDKQTSTLGNLLQNLSLNNVRLFLAAE